MTPAFNDEAWNARRKELEEALGLAIQALLDHTGAAGFELQNDGYTIAVRPKACDIPRIKH